MREEPKLFGSQGRPEPHLTKDVNLLDVEPEAEDAYVDEPVDVLHDGERIVGAGHHIVDDAHRRDARSDPEVIYRRAPDRERRECQQRGENAECSQRRPHVP